MSASSWPVLPSHTTSDPLVGFFYLLLRDGALAGTIEAAIREMERDAAAANAGLGKPVVLTNGYIGQYAENLAARTRQAITMTDEAPSKRLHVYDGTDTK